MNQELTIQQQQQVAITNFRTELANQTKALKSMLPSHIEVERFQRAAVTAVSNNHDLLGADRNSLFNALTRCAGDGLLPDNREAAMVIYKTKVNNNWIAKAQYMPMVYGIIKRMRNSGEVSTIESHIVYSNDTFDFELGDSPKLYHKPRLDGERGKPLLVYCVINFKDGEKYREIMTINEIEKARSKSKSKDNGPWKDWWEEMAKKTVIHRAAKRCPSSADIDKMLQHDMKVTLNPESVEEEPVENKPRKNKIIDNVEEIIDAEVVEQDTPQSADDIFPGDVPEGMTSEEYYEEQYGNNAG